MKPLPFLGHYILDQNKMAVPVEMMEWAVWFETATRTRRRVVAQEMIEHYAISTVFMGIDMGFFGEPLLFETMVFDYADDSSDVWMERCGTWDEAIDMHERAVVHMQGLLRLLPVVLP